MKLEFTRTLLPAPALGKVDFLMGFDFGDEPGMYHLIALPVEGDSEDSIGIWKEGDDFCARIGINSLREFHRAAKAEQLPEGTA